MHVLTEYELQIVCLVAEGFSDQEIVEQLGVGEGELRKHLIAIYGDSYEAVTMRSVAWFTSARRFFRMAIHKLDRGRNRPQTHQLG